jgi:hypothetical protein
MPPEAKGIKIEAIYDSFSTLVLLTLPVALWNLLPENSAYSFVGFITSDNNLPLLEDAKLALEVNNSRAIFEERSSDNSMDLHYFNLNMLSMEIFIEWDNESKMLKTLWKSTDTSPNFKGDSHVAEMLLQQTLVGMKRRNENVHSRQVDMVERQDEDATKAKRSIETHSTLGEVLPEPGHVLIAVCE